MNPESISHSHCIRESLSAEFHSANPGLEGASRLGLESRTGLGYWK